MSHLIASRYGTMLPGPDGTQWQLADLDLRLDEGAALAIVASQPGLATQVARALAGHENPHRGGIILAGRELAAPDPRVAVFGARPDCSPLRRAAGYLRREAARAFGRRLDAAEMDRWITHNLHLVGLDDVRELRIRKLSAATLARLQVAAALASDAQVLFFDHLFDHLDVPTATLCVDLMLEIQQRMSRTLVFATDQLDQAILFADQVLCLTVADGTIRWQLVEVDLLRPRARVDLERSEEARRALADLREILGRPEPGNSIELGRGELPTPDSGAEVVKLAEWVSSHPPRTGKLIEKQRLTLGFLPLIDCAPLVIALEEGFFAGAGLEVTLSRESSWSNVQDKVSLGLLDGAQMLAATPLAAALDPHAAPLLTALSLGRNGNAVTVSRALFESLGGEEIAADDALGLARALAGEVARRRAARQRPLVFATVAPHSCHNYLLRYWLACGGIDPDTDLKMVVVPPPQMVSYLSAGMIDGFCVGEPWNTLAAADGLGRPLLGTWQIWNNHPEKVLGVTRAWAEANPNAHRGLIRALLDASWWLDNAENRAAACEILAQGRYVNVSADLLRRSLGDADGAPGAAGACQQFHVGAANFPWRSHAAWLLAQMVRWGQVALPRDAERVCTECYRTDIYLAATSFGDARPTASWKCEGSHPIDWQLPGEDRAVMLGPDRFMDGRMLDGCELATHLAGYEIPRHGHPATAGHAA